MIVWLSERGRARHDQTVSVSVRRAVEVVAGPDLDSRDLALVRQWIELNRATLIAYWDGDLLTDEAIARLRPVAPAP